jgi:MFS family permease
MNDQQSSRSAVRRIALARAISIAGGAAAFTALMFAVYERTHHDPLWLAAALILTFGMNGVLGWFAGALGDRFDRRRVMIVSDLAGASVFAAAAFVHDPGLLLVCGFLAAVAESPFWSASGAAIPALVDDPKDIEHANSLVAIGVNSGIFLGPAIGGLFIGAVGANAIFGANAVSFVLSAALIWSVRRPFHERVTVEHTDEHRGVWAGIRFIVSDGVLRRILIASSVMVVFIGLVMVSDLPLVHVFYGRPDEIGRGYGLLIACWGLGSVAGSFLARRLTERTEIRWLIVTNCGFAVSLIFQGAAPWFVLMLGFVLVNGTCDAVSMVAVRSIHQRRAPDIVRSRVMAAQDAAANLGVAIGYAIAAPIVSAAGPRLAYIGAGVGALGSTALLLRLRHVSTETGVEGAAVMEGEPA